MTAEPTTVTAAALRAHVAAFNARDLDALLAGFAPDAHWVTGGYAVRGRVELRAFFAAALAGLLPTLEIRALVADGSAVAAELIERFTHDGTEKVAAIAGFYRFRDGLIARATIYREGSADPGDAPDGG